MRRPTRVLLLLSALALATPAAALVIDSQDTALESAPADDPGWANVGRLAKVSAVYLGGGWVLTAQHSGMADVELDGVSYPPVPGSRVVLHAPGTPDTASDLALFRIDPAPDLPPLELTRRSPGRGTFVVLMGYGWVRGEPLEKEAGFRWTLPQAKRWGTNRVTVTEVYLSGPGAARTRGFRVDFSRVGTTHEAQAAKGDSGGAVFLKEDGAWRLAGILVTISGDHSQEGGTALYGNSTNAADLSAYRGQILRVLRSAGASP